MSEPIFDRKEHNLKSYQQFLDKKETKEDIDKRKGKFRKIQTKIVDK